MLIYTPGCYTCRFRKVRCKASVESQHQGKEKPLKCDNCHRLGFQCKWDPPASGEKYIPPPKRRRAARENREAINDGRAINSSHSLIQTPGVPIEDQSHDATELVCDAENNETDTGSIATDMHGANHYQLGYLDTLATAPDISLEYDIFDLNLAGEGLDFVPLPNIDLRPQTYSEQDPARVEWSDILQIPDLSRASGKAAGSNDDISTDTRSSASPSVTEDNRRLIQHYLDVMKGFAKVEDYSRNTNNLFISAFSESLCFPPLFYAILCFSASHLGMEDKTYLDQAKRYDQLAKDSFDVFAKDQSVQTDGLLSALFVRVKTIHITGGSVEVFLDLMTKAFEIISSTLGVKDAKQPSDLTKRIIIRLAMLDARAAYYRLGGGRLVNSLKDIPALAFIFDSKVETENSQKAIIDLLRGTILRMRVAELDVQLHEQMSAEVVSARPLRTAAFTSLYDEIYKEIDKWEQKAGQTTSKGPRNFFCQDEIVDPTRFNYYIVLCALHSALLYLYIVYVSIRTLS